MKPKLKKQLNGYNKNTIVKLIIRGTDGYEVKTDKTNEHIAFLTVEDKKDYIK